MNLSVFIVFSLVLIYFTYVNYLYTKELQKIRENVAHLIRESKEERKDLYDRIMVHNLNEYKVHKYGGTKSKGSGNFLEDSLEEARKKHEKDSVMVEDDHDE